MSPYRSLLFVPAGRPELFAKADDAGSDALIYDLEDSVPAAGKRDARLHLSQALGRALRSPAYVRINHPDVDDAAEDINAVHGDHVRGVILPKAERTADIARVSALLAEAEKRTARTERSLSIVPMIETCLGLRNVYDLVTCDARVTGIALASAEEGDFMRDMGGRWTATGEALLYPRSKLVCESRAAGVEWIVDGVFMNLADAAALERECLIARDLGYVGKMAIHPRQLKPIHDAFTPSEKDLEYAARVVAAYREAEQKGHGAVRYRGMMVDYANVRRAEAIIAAARRAEK